MASLQGENLLEKHIAAHFSSREFSEFTSSGLLYRRHVPWHDERSPRAGRPMVCTYCRHQRTIASHTIASSPDGRVSNSDATPAATVGG